MSTVSCQLIEELLSPYNDGELPAEQHQQVRLHLQSCPTCERTRRQLQQAWELLGQGEELIPSPTFRAQVWERVRREPVGPGWRWAWAWVAPVALGLLLVGGWWGRPSGEPVGPPALATREEPAQEQADQELAALVPAWDLEPSELPALADWEPAGELTHLEPLQLGQLSDGWLDEAHEALDQELGGS